MIAHPALTDDAVVLRSRSSSKGRGAGTLALATTVLVDEALDKYIDWREQQRAVVDAYARWSDAPGAEKNLRFGAYNAALDQEETSAKVYAESIGQLERCLARRGAPAADHRDGTAAPHPDPDES